MVSVYQVWQLDCPCGEVVSYGEDWSSVPEACEACGAPVGKDDEEEDE